MAYNNFSLQDAIGQFELNLTESAFCESLPPVSAKPEFLNIFEQYLPLAQKAKSEKAKSELLISPIPASVAPIGRQSNSTIFG